MKFEYPEGATPIDAGAAPGLLQPQITTQAQLNEAEESNNLAGSNVDTRKKAQCT